MREHACLTVRANTTVILPAMMALTTERRMRPFDGFRRLTRVSDDPWSRAAWDVADRAGPKEGKNR